MRHLARIRARLIMERWTSVTKGYRWTKQRELELVNWQISRLREIENSMSARGPYSTVWMAL